MTDPTPYLESLIFYVEFLAPGELLPQVATVYHETKESIKKYVSRIETRNNWKCIGIKYKDMRTGIMREFKQ